MGRTRSALVRALQVLPAWLSVLLFLAGTFTLTGGTLVAGVLPPTAAIVAGVLGFTAWLVVHLVATDAVRSKPRRRRR